MDDKSPAPVNYDKIYSPSRLSMFDTCHTQYHFSYQHEIYKKMKNKLKNLPENIWSFYTIGKAIHNAIILFYHLPVTDRTLSSLKLQLRKTWLSEAQWNKRPPLGKWGGFKTEDEERRAYSDSLTMLTNFYQLGLIDPPIFYLPTDDFRHSINDYIDLISPLNDDYDISGKFDLILKNGDGTLYVIDFKTSKKEEADHFQLLFYKALAEMRFQMPVTRARLYFLRSGNHQDIPLEEITTSDIQKQIEDKIQTIESQKTSDPKPSKLCKYCLFKTFCPAHDQVMEIIKDISDDSIPDDLPF